MVFPFRMKLKEHATELPLAKPKPQTRLRRCLLVICLACVVAHVIVGKTSFLTIKNLAHLVVQEPIHPKLFFFSNGSVKTGREPARFCDVLAKRLADRRGKKSSVAVDGEAGNKKRYSNPDLAREEATAEEMLYYVTTQVSGRLGNQMFQYASLLGIAATNNKTAVYPRHGELQDVFLVTRVEDISFEGPTLFESRSRSYDPTFEDLPDSNAYVMQYLQSWKYFHCHRDLIVKEFRLKPLVKENAARHISHLLLGRREINLIKIGVHVRRGDLFAKKQLDDGYHVPPESYIYKAAQLMRKKYGVVIFIVVSDEVAWCKLYLTDNDFVFAYTGSAWDDLAILTLCDHVIMTVGTYGWWGGYLAGGDVIYYNNSARPKSHLDVVSTPEDFFLPYWIGLGD